MLSAYFMSTTERWHAALPINNELEAWAVVMKYKEAVPTIKITNEEDYTVLESIKGKITFPYLTPQFVAEEINRLSHTFQPAQLPASGRESIQQVVKDHKNALSELNKLMSAQSVNEATVNEAKNQVVSTEQQAVSLAARDDLNLYEYGFEFSQIMRPANDWSLEPPGSKQDLDYDLNRGIEI